MIPVFFGLVSAIVWGAADFTGGLASRKAGAFRVVLFGELVGELALLPTALSVGEPYPSATAWVQALLAGALGTLGLLLLYHALATGTMSIAAPVSALMAAIIPVVVGAFTEGIPGGLVITGFAFALMAVWFVSQSSDSSRGIAAHFSTLRLPLFAGIGFGCFFVLMHAAAQESTLWPMVASRSAGLSVILAFMLLRRDSFRVPRAAWPIIVLNGLLDIGGNLFYLLAGQAGRMDVSAVLSSLYPGATVLLAWILLKERLSSMQWVGIACAFLTIVLFTL